MIADNVLRDVRRKRLRHRLVELGVDPVAPQAEEVDYVKYARMLLDLFHSLVEPNRAYVRAWLLCGGSVFLAKISLRAISELLSCSGTSSRGEMR
jgi:hypothetical protein